MHGQIASKKATAQQQLPNGHTGGEPMYMDDEREMFFIEAHREYYSKMENVCRAYVQYNEEYRSLIDESIQETYLTAVRNYKKLKTHPALEGWFIETCFHRFSTALAKYRRRQAYHQVSMNDEKVAPQVADTVDNIDIWWQNEINTRVIQRIIDALSEREAQVYHEYFENQKSMAEVAESQNTTVSAIKSILTRIRKKAREMSRADFLFFLFSTATFSTLVRLIR